MLVDALLFDLTTMRVSVASEPIFPLKCTEPALTLQKVPIANKNIKQNPIFFSSYSSHEFNVFFISFNTLRY